LSIFAEQESVGSETAESGAGGLGLRHYLEIVRRRKWIVLSIFTVAVAAALAISLTMANVYQAKTTIVVGQGNSLFQPGEASAVQPFTATMGDLVKSNVVARTVISQLHLPETPEDVLNKISVSINPQTAVVKIAVRDHSKPRAVAIADRVGKVFSQLVKKRFGTKAEPSAVPGTPVQLPLTATVFDPAHADPKPVAPRPFRNTVLAGILGLILGLIAAFLREHFDRDLRTRDAVEKSFGVPVIGQVPSVHKGRRVLARHTFGPVDEALRALRANLQYLGVRRPLRTLLITSAGAEQGKTTLAANLAVVLAQSGASSVIIDGDLRRPALDRLFETERGLGLTSVLVGAADLEDVLVELPDAVTAGADSSARLSFLASGPLPPNPSELLSSTPMAKVLDRLGVLYDYVVIDSPPLLLVADALELARVVDGVILVVRRNETTTDEAREVRGLVDRLGINVVGVVFTDVKPIGGYGYGYGPYAPEQATETPAAVRSGL
jgi:capsular exopolysaccharide synthesis family protein